MLYRKIEDAERKLLAGWRWPHFGIWELACRCAGRHCAGEYWHDPESLTGLEQMRRTLGAPLIVTSGHRCKVWNRAVGGVRTSQHLRFAADLLVRRHDRADLLQAARAAGFTGLGLGRDFLHVDRRDVPASWDYQGSGLLWTT